MRTAAAVVVFLLGTTFLWLTPSFAGSDREPSSSGWTFVQVLAWLSILAFAGSAWGLFRDADWWVPVGIAAGVAGLVCTVVYGLVARGSANYASNLVVHAVISLAVIVLLALPAAREALTNRL